MEELIARIAERYAQPTNAQLKARLIVAAAFQRAFIQTVKFQGVQNTLRICDWFQEVYCFLVDLHNHANGSAEVLHLLRNTPESQGGLRYACEWLFDENRWQSLPAEIMDLANPSP